MKNEKLFNLALICTLIGLLIIIFISDNIEINYSLIKDISKKDIDKQVKIKGIISSIIQKESLTLYNIEDSTGKIKVIVFNENFLDLQNNKTIEVIGKVLLYQGILEINAEQIKTIE